MTDEPNRELVGRDVVDAIGQRIGRLESVYRDVEDQAVFFAAVAMLRRGRRRLVFVPLVDATIGPASVTLRCGALLARRAPQTRPGDLFPRELEADLYRHYDLPYRPRTNGRARLRPV